mmetsp:Transcript_12489/g.18737  ORF Transcript_12489/g.18737 Transcript_12489/m.18737 type:complete len:203 (+) Transcript_12489:152-760(+)
MMSGYHNKEKPDFDDSCRSGATHLDCSSSDRSEFDGVDFFGFGARSKLTRSCLIVKTQHDSLRQLPTSELKRSSLRSSTSSISFDKVTLRKYDVILTDHPSTTAGPPIGLGWDYDQEEPFDVDAYENTRAPPRSKREFLVPSSRRWEMLRLAGTSNTDLRKASEEVKERQTQRRRSLRRQQRMELLASGIRCILPRGKNKQQ